MPSNIDHMEVFKSSLERSQAPSDHKSHDGPECDLCVMRDQLQDQSARICDGITAIIESIGMKQIYMGHETVRRMLETNVGTDSNEEGKSRLTVETEETIKEIEAKYQATVDLFMKSHGDHCSDIEHSDMMGLLQGLCGKALSVYDNIRKMDEFLKAKVSIGKECYSYSQLVRADETFLTGLLYEARQENQRLKAKLQEHAIL